MDQALAAEAAREALIHVNKRILESTPTTLPKWTITAKPYLKAIAAENYGYEDPEMCVLYALDNLSSWRGDDARRIKAALNTAIK